MKGNDVTVIDNTRLKPELHAALAKAKKAALSGRLKQVDGFLTLRLTDELERYLKNTSSRVDVIYDYALVLRLSHHPDKAQRWFEAVLDHQEDAMVYNELSTIAQGRGQWTKAIEYQQRAAALAPENAVCLNNLAKSLVMTGRQQQGIDLFKRAVAVDPANGAIYSNMLFYLHALPGVGPEEMFEAHQRWGQKHAPPQAARLNHRNEPVAERRLRIGYISPDFRVHPVAYFFEPLLQGHRHDQFEIYGYSDAAAEDHVTERMKGRFDHYRQICGLNDDAVAEAIVRDQIDILIELAGHTANNRLKVMATKSAPIQVTYLGAPDTTGLEAMDYRLTDAAADPPGSQAYYTEQLVYLPGGLFCYRPADSAEAISPLPALRNGYVTFGSFNSSVKINSKMIALWSEILSADDKFRLVIKLGISPDKEIMDFYFGHFERFGIDRSRIAICGWLPVDQQFGIYASVDIALDTWPWNGYTTSCEALWMGLPVVSLAGNTHASRIGLSLLGKLDLEFFAAANETDYVKKAIAAAANLESLAKIRSSMRQRFSASGLCDGRAFAAGVEALYRKMWQKWCGKTR